MNSAPDADTARVCIVHLAFVPCRHGEPGSECFTVTNRASVMVVRAYQRSEIGEREARMFFDSMKYAACLIRMAPVLVWGDFGVTSAHNKDTQ